MRATPVKHIERIWWDFVGWPGWITCWGAAMIAAHLVLVVSAWYAPTAALTGVIVFAVLSHVDDIARVRKRAHTLHKAHHNDLVNFARWVRVYVRAVRVEIGFTPLARKRAWFRRMCEVLAIEPPPMVLAWRGDEYEEEFTLRIIATASMSTVEFARRTERIRDYIGRRVLRVHIIPGQHGGLVFLRLILKDRTSEMLTDWPQLATEIGTTSIVDGIHVGKDGTWSDVRLDVVNDAVFVAGQRGTGKSGFLQILVAAAAQCRDAEVIPIDLKDGAEFWMWRDRVNRYADNPDDAERIIDSLLLERTKRARELTKMKLRKWAPGCGMPFLLVVIDELAELPMGEGAAQWKLTKLLRLGRAQGIGVICATQRPSANWVDTSLRAQCNVAVSFRVKDTTEASIALGPGSVGSGYEPHNLPKPGVFLIIGDDEQTPRRCRSYYLSDKDVASFVEKLPQIVSEVATESATDRLQEPIEALPIEGPRPADRLSATGAGWPAPASVRIEGPEPPGLDRNEKRRRVWRELVNHPGWITRGRLAKLANVSDQGASKMLREWQDAGLVESGPGQTWRRREHQPDVRDVA